MNNVEIPFYMEIAQPEVYELQNIVNTKIVFILQFR